MRTYEISRKTKETDIELKLDIDGKGISDIDSGCPFLDHMLTLFAKHARFDLAVKCVGDVEVDYHHTVEDIGICLGKAIDSALGDKRGICRYGNMTLPMDEALILSAIDLSGRSCLSYEAYFEAQKTGDFDAELAEEFWQAFVRNANCALHIKQLDGRNTHHIIEGQFKSVARSLRKAVSYDESAMDEIPSTKGVL